MRHIILHNHLFKNAGTSVDHILRQNFSDRWVTREFESTANENTAEVAQWICTNPMAAAFSSHTLQGPLPEIDGVRIIPIVLLRDPVARIASAYRFERVQQADTRGTRLAREHGFAGYVHARLSCNGDRQCRNFQTSRLAAWAPGHPGSELARAKAAIDVISRTGIVGLVSDFQHAMDRLQSILCPWFPEFAALNVRANASGLSSASTVSPDMRKTLEGTNADDLNLVAYAGRLQGQAPTLAGTDQVAGMV